MTTLNTVHLTDMGLLHSLKYAKARLEGYQEQISHIEMEIMRRMENRGATSIPNVNANGEKVYICERKDTYGYSPDKFIPLKEILNTPELAECYTEEHWEYSEPFFVEGKWVTTNTIKAVAKRHGAEALAIVEGAKYLRSSTLDFRRI